MPLGRKIIKHVTLGLIAEGEEASKSDNQTSQARNGCAVVSDSAETINGRSLERAVDEERVVVAYKC